MTRVARRLAVIAAVFAAAWTAVPAVAAPPAWTIAISSTPPHTASEEVGAVDCPTVTFCVQVGSGLTIKSGRPSQHSVPFAVVHDGSQVTATVLPLPIDAAPADGAGVSAVDCVTVRSCVAVGGYTSYDGRSRPLVDTYRAGTWSASSVPGPGAGAFGLGLSDVACNASGCLAIGGYYNGYNEQPYLAVRDVHGTWTDPAIIDQPYFFDVRSPVCPPSGGCYAQGYEYPGDPSSLQRASLLYPSTGGWARSYFPAPAGADMHSLVIGAMACPADQFCTGVGSYRDASGANHLVAERLVNGRLSAREIAIRPADAARSTYLYPAATSCGSVEAGTPCAAAATFGTDQRNHALLLDFTAGTWRVRVAPAPAGGAAASVDLRDVSCSANGTCTAVGTYSTAGAHLGLAETWNRSRWQPITVGPPPGAPAGEDVTLDAVSCAGGHCAASGSLGGYPRAGDEYHLLYAQSG